VASSQASLGRSQIDLSRAQTLRKPGYVSEERVTTLSADNHIARSRWLWPRPMQGQRQQVNALNAEIKRLDALIANARTDLAQAELNLTRSEIHAPISGLVGQRAARNGQYVQAGAYLLSIVPDQDIWIQANFKETQIGHMQRAKSRADLRRLQRYPDRGAGRQPVRRLRGAVQPVAAGQCHRQLHQSRTTDSGETHVRRGQPEGKSAPCRSPSK
jgi:multidrug resistance efflux pump